MKDSPNLASPSFYVGEVGPLHIHHQHPHGTLADGIDLQRLQRSAVGVDPVGRQSRRFQSGGVEEIARRVQAEGPGNVLGGCLPQRRQRPVRRVHGEPRDTVVAPVGRVEEPARRGYLYLRAGIVLGVSLRQGGRRLEGAQRAVGAVEAVRRNAAALFVGRVHHVQVRVEADVARALG